MVWGVFGGFFVLGVIEGLSLKAIFGETLSDFDLLIITMVTGIVLGVALPTLLYLLGEWIGRSLDQALKALTVAVASAVLAPLLAIITLAMVMRMALSEFVSQVMIPLGMPVLQHVPAQEFVYLLLLMLSILVPVSVGAVRGARYKEFFDLAFFAKRLGSSEQKDIDDFVMMIQRDYAQKVSTASQGV